VRSRGYPSARRLSSAASRPTGRTTFLTRRISSAALSTAAFGCRRACRSGRARFVVAEAHDKWLGRGFPIQYVEFDDFRWSSPIEVGLADRGNRAIFGGSIWRAYDLATTDNERTFVVWPTAKGIVGRWIDPRR
jgi:hypothetical protein